MSSRQRFSRHAVSFLVVAGSVALGGVVAVPPAPSVAALPEATFVDLGAAETYSVLGGTSVANTGTGTVLAGDLGLSPAGTITGFPPGTLNGTIHDKDEHAEIAQADRAEAYAAAAGQASTTTFAGDQAGATFHPGVHTSAAAFANTGTMTLDADGDSNAVFIFQIGAALSSAAGSKVVLTDGALANNVYWQVVGAIALGADAKYVGTFLGAGAIAFGDGASLKGRALTPTSVAMTNSAFTAARDDLTAPVVTIDGGAARSTKDTTPTVSGTTDEPSGGTVTVAVDGQTLSTTVGDGGIWAVSATALASGPHALTASITDPSQNVGTADQTLTIDVMAPVVTINGGAATATNDTTPEISGSTDESPGTPVTITVGGQMLTTTVGSDGGAWTVTPTALTESAHSVVASVNDSADNSTTETQILSVDLTVPVVAIDGGLARSTLDTSPWTYGTTAEPAGSTVHLTIGTQHLTAVVQQGGTWGVSASALSVGTHSVVASLTDAAQNAGSATQTLTITAPVGTNPSPPLPFYRPDAAVRVLGGGYVGLNRYGTVQRVTKLLRRTRTGTFYVRIANRGNASDRMEILGAPATRQFKVTYLVGGRNVTRAVLAGSYLTGALAPGASTILTLKVTRTAAARPGHRRIFSVRVDSSRSTSRDTVAAVVVR